jgi:hypothetical protein
MEYLLAAQTGDSTEQTWSGWLSGVSPTLFVIAVTALVVIIIRRGRG